MTLYPELRTLMNLKAALEKESPWKRALVTLKVIMAFLIMVCLLLFIAVWLDKVSVLLAMPIVAICGLLVGYISYYIHSIEIWSYYRPHINLASVEKRLNEIKT